MSALEFKKLNSVEISGNRFPDLDPGSYDVEISNIKGLDTRERGEAYIVEFRTIPGQTMHKWYLSMVYPDSAYKDLVKFIFAVLGLNPAKEKDKELIAKEVTPNLETLAKASLTGEFIGKKVHVDVHMRTRKSGKAYPDYTWSPFQVIS